ncbi:MAG: hypothetical protein WCI71_01170 [Bacteroidota bacterium]
MKKILICIFLGVSLSFTIENGKQPSENGKLSGVVTFKEVYASEKQADPGAEIYAVNETDIRSTQYDAIESVMGNFQFSKFNYFLSINTVIDPRKIKKTQDDFEVASDLAFKYINGFMHIPGIVRAAANATGKYTLKLKSGKYYILVISGSVKSSNIAESTGNIDFKIAEVKSAGETFLDINFIKHERIISFSLVPAGC